MCNKAGDLQVQIVSHKAQATISAALVEKDACSPQSAYNRGVI
jgi:uncharacterized protein YjfI (DUF2170 family)